MINLLNINVEGHEISVLKGAKKILRVTVLNLFIQSVFLSVMIHLLIPFSMTCAIILGYGFYFFACYHEAFTLKSASAIASVLFVNKSMLPDAAYGRVTNIV